MATKKDIKAWLKELNLTEADVDAMWEELKEVNGLVRQLTASSVDWRGLNIGVIKQIPTQKGKDLQRLEEARIKAEQDAADAKRKQVEKDNYINNFETIMVGKIDAGEHLTEDELKTLVYEYEEDSHAGGHGRWTQFMQTIVSLNGRYFAINWQKGLTENQDNDFQDQPFEVTEHEYVKTIIVKEWLPKRHLDMNNT